MKKIYNIININLTSVSNDVAESDVPCGSCVFCCERLSPFLTPEEISSGRYPLQLIQPEPEELKINPKIGPTVVLFRKPGGGCSMLVDGKCTIYEYRPRACRQFDCRQGHHPKIPDMTKNHG